MGKIIDFLSGTKILEEAESPINGKITVIQSLAFGTYIQVGGLTQSGGIIHDVWKKPLQKIRNSKFETRNCLILGLGGGTVVKLVKKLWPKAKITGVDIDPVMVKMGKKYLGLDNKGVKVHIGDAYDFLNQKLKAKNQNDISKIKKYDLVLVDLYVGDEFPKKFESEPFLIRTRNNLAHNGTVVFNRLYYGDKRSQAVKFCEKLERIFSKVEVVYPEANVMYICNLF